MSSVRITIVNHLFVCCGKDKVQHILIYICCFMYGVLVKSHSAAAESIHLLLDRLASEMQLFMCCSINNALFIFMT